jgi:uncharacterized membrane protein
MLYDPNRPRPEPRIWPLFLVSGIAVVATITVLFVYWYEAGYLTGDNFHRPGGIFYFGFAPIFIILLVVILLVRMAFWSRMWGYRNSRRGYYRSFPDPAVMTARQRFARGEITREQYDQIMTELSRRRSGP